MSEVLKQLKVRTGVVKRLTKELGYYSKERDDEAARVEKMRADGKDSHDIKQAENCLAESAMMIPQTREKLEAGFADLESCVAENGAETAESEELKAANEALEAAKAALAA
ncbi:hypothetical protein FOA52_004761 [Chlamydomonas sp. UWO 241]|nr:hypothetical protein FOA52_004761 [Chlamydomonas sp. UWO 241]